MYPNVLACALGYINLQKNAMLMFYLDFSRVYIYVTII